MRKNFYLLAVLFVSALFLFPSCNDDDGVSPAPVSRVISGTIENFPTDGKYILEAEVNETVVATAEIASDGKFTITLPEEIATEELDLLANIESLYNVSDGSVSIKALDFEVYKENGSYLSGLALGKYDNGVRTIAVPTYSNGKATISGTAEEHQEFGGVEGKAVVTVNCALQTGWNWILITERSGSIVQVSKNPSGLKWVLENDLYKD